MRIHDRSPFAPWLAALLALCACGGDDDGGSGSAGSGGGGGASAGAGGASGAAGAGSGGNAGSSSSGGGTGGRSGGGGASGAGGAAAGMSGGGDGGSDADAGSDGGVMSGGATVCKAPVAEASSGNECPASDPVALELELVKDGLGNTPVFVTSPPGDSDRLFVVERAGRILILNRADGAEIGTFMTVQNVDSSTGTGEKGLLGLAFHPDYPDDPRFFVNFTRQGDMGLETAIASYEVSAANPDEADPDSETILLDYGQPQANHNGGMVVFGPDGCLFVGAGDGGNSNDEGPGHAPEGNGQNLDTHLGKMLRLDVDDPSAAAPGNLEGAGHPHIWDYGLRNPWRFSFDRMTGDLYIGDVGQGEIEEVDVEPKGTGQLNYGWPILEGSACLVGGCDDPGGLVNPVDEYDHADGNDCVVGGYVYRGSAIPSLQGFYLYADNGPSRRIWAFVWDGEGRCDDTTIPISERDGIDLTQDITSFGEDASGELYVTTMDAVYRIVAQ